MLRASHVSALAPVCDVLVEEGHPQPRADPDHPRPARLPTRSWSTGTRNDADVGVGTVLTDTEATKAIDCGAQYLVTPTMNVPVIELAVRHRIAVFPGGLTPTELAAGWNAGATAVKIFPAQTVGADISSTSAARSPSCRPSPPAESTSTAIREWLAAGAVAVSLGGPLLGDALTGGDLTRCASAAGRFAQSSTPAHHDHPDGPDLRRSAGRLRHH